eukprot:gene7419-10021_t
MTRGTGRLLDAYRRGGNAFFKAKDFQPKLTAQWVSARSKISSSPLSALWIKCFSYNYGIRSYRTQKTEMTLNLLLGSRLDPRISAWEQLHGKYNYDAHPIAPLGMRIVLHEKPHQRGSWSPHHGVEGFYLGPALATDTRVPVVFGGNGTLEYEILIKSLAPPLTP